jgi:hypothetical protein
MEKNEQRRRKGKYIRNDVGNEYVRKGRCLGTRKEQKRKNTEERRRQLLTLVGYVPSMLATINSG